MIKDEKGGTVKYDWLIDVIYLFEDWLHNRVGFFLDLANLIAWLRDTSAR